VIGSKRYVSNHKDGQRTIFFKVTILIITVTF